MAADSAHLGGELRPSDTLPLPELIDVPGLQLCPCPSSVLLREHPRNSSTLPFLGLDPSFPLNLKDAEQTIERLQAFDADERVLVVFAHDVSLFDIVDFFPATANEWRQKGWKEKGRWSFLPHLQKVARGEGGSY